MHALHQYLVQLLGDLLKRRRVVVFYDPRKEFLPFFHKELQSAADAGDGLQRVFLGEDLVFLATWSGSFLALRDLVEPLVAEESPPRMVLYLPGVRRDLTGSVLMELDKGGEAYEPSLKRLARNVLRQHLSDGQIDDLLKPESLAWDDVVAILDIGHTGTASILKVVFGGAPSEPLLAQWLADPSRDPDIQQKGATPELLKLVHGRLGLEVPEGIGLPEARDRVARYLLVNEFRSDLKGPPPLSIGQIPATPTKDHLDRVLAVVAKLRKEHGERYPDLADKVQTALGLAAADLDPASLGSIDTFRFEERRLLAYAADRIVLKQYGEAMAVVTGRQRSFWVDRDVGRQAQWEACRLAADLGMQIERVRKILAKVGSSPRNWLDAYADEGQGAWQMDLAHRRLETWAAKMAEDPEAERALGVVRREHEDLVRVMADGFSKAFIAGGWSVPGALLQTRVYPEVVKGTGGRVAWFWVDAMRYEMGMDLAAQLQGALDVAMRPGVAALPSITPVGMAALLPGASASFTVVAHGGKLASRIEDVNLPSVTERLKFLAAKVPAVAETTLNRLVQMKKGALEKTVGDSSLVVVRSQEIDFVGEMDGDFMARQVVDTIIGTLARAVRKLADAGIEHFVITADHGHLFGARREEDMRTDNPGGDCTALHRRCWVGRGGTTPPGTVRVTGADLGYQTDLEFVFPTGLGVFKAGGNASFHHGGISLQEMVIPVLSFRMPPWTGAKVSGESRIALTDVAPAVTNRTFLVTVNVKADLLDTEPVSCRVVLVSQGEQVGQAGMAMGGHWDSASGILRVDAGQKATVGILLARDDCPSLHVLVLDPATDAVLAKSDELPVKLGI